MNKVCSFFAKFKSYTDCSSCLCKQEEQSVTVKPWWFTTEAGKFAVKVAHEKDLAITLDVIKSAVLAGELDEQIDVAATKLRAGFVK